MLPCVASQKKKSKIAFIAFALHYCMCSMLQYAFGALFSNLSQVFFCILFFILTRICVCVSVGLHEKSGEEEKFLNIFNWTFASSRENTTTKGGNWVLFLRLLIS